MLTYGPIIAGRLLPKNGYMRSTERIDTWQVCIQSYGPLPGKTELADGIRACSYDDGVGLLRLSQQENVSR